MKLIKSAAILVLLVLLSTCETYEDFAPYETFTIKAGKHGSGLKTTQLYHEYLVFDVIFDETAIYETQDPNNQADVNKLFGFSDCNSNHVENSARFGWRWYEDELQILGFVHFNGDIEILELGSVELNKSYRYEMYLGDDEYFFRVIGVTDEQRDFVGGVASMRRSGSVCNVGYYYRLWPYFGGDETAPHDIKIHMRRVYEFPE